MTTKEDTGAVCHLRDTFAQLYSHLKGASKHSRPKKGPIAISTVDASLADTFMETSCAEHLYHLQDYTPLCMLSWLCSMPSSQVKFIFCSPCMFSRTERSANLVPARP